MYYYYFNCKHPAQIISRSRRQFFNSARISRRWSITARAITFGGSSVKYPWVVLRITIIYSHVKFPGRSIPFYHHHNELIFIHYGGTLSLCRGRSCSAKKEKLQLVFFLIGGYRLLRMISANQKILKLPSYHHNFNSVSVLLPGTLAQPLLVVHSCSMISRERDDLGE